MYDFYKCLSGFIANGFREPTVMLPMVLAYFLPVFCFLFYFYDFYVKNIHKVIRIAYSVFVILYAVANLIFIFKNFELYSSNHLFGAYDALPSIVIHFPYDVILIHAGLIILQIINIITAFLPGCFYSLVRENMKNCGTLKLCVAEYVFFSVLAIVVFVFMGSSIYAIFSSYKNAFYDFRYVFLILWVLIIPLMNLLYLVFKPEKRISKTCEKIAALGIGIGINVIFTSLLLIFEITYPDFMVHIGKPLFLIAFSVSLPIEMGVILGITLLGTLAMAVKLLLVLIQKKKAYKKQL